MMVEAKAHGERHSNPGLKIIIFEPESDGHNAEYICHLVRYIIAQRPPCDLTFAISHVLLMRLPDDVRHALVTGQGTCTWHEIPATDLADLNTLVLWRRGLARWRYLARLVQIHRADHGHFLFLDHALLGAALGLARKGPGEFSGILFRPTQHYGMIGSAERKGERRRNLKKEILYRGALLHPRLTTIFSLDPYFPAYAAGRYRRGGDVIALPDPAPNIPTQLRRCPPATARERTQLLLFGALTERKGILQTLDALSLLADDVARQIEVVFAGRIAEDCRAAFFACLAKLQARSAGARIVVHDRYLAEDELPRLVAQADIILAPYQQHVGSSGLLYWAAAAGKPIITQDYGLVGRLMRDLKLGVTCDSTVPAALSAAIATAVACPASTLAAADGQRRLLEGHRPAQFAEALIGTILARAAGGWRAISARDPRTTRAASSGRSEIT